MVADNVFEEISTVQDTMHVEITLGLLTLTVVSVEILNLSDSNLPINDLSSIPLTYCSTHKTRLYC